VDEDCAAFEDENHCNGTMACDLSEIPSRCVVDPATKIECALPVGAEPQCSIPICDPDTGTCGSAPTNGGEPCDDGDACTVDETCSGGGCHGVARVCDDSDPCTDDSCDSEHGCRHAYNQQPCDDGDPCTLGDTCTGGACLSTEELHCTDGLQCTDDRCVPGEGCRFEDNDAVCEDGDPCTVGDRCKDGACAGGLEVECDDSNPCTGDVCEGGSCVHVPAAGPCEDGDACTIADTCEDGECAPGAALNCDDSNPCTDDPCVEGACRHDPVLERPCDDGLACTDGDACDDAGSCRGIPRAGCCTENGDCDDSDPCTADLCDGATGLCSHDPAPLEGVACDADGDGCTENDRCEAGTCVAGLPVDCSKHSDGCNTGVCASAGSVGYACLKVPLPPDTECEDGDFCTVGDRCDGDGACLRGADRDCASELGQCRTASCDEVSDACVGPPLEDATPCDADGDGCTAGDACKDGVCEAGAPVDCAAQDTACTLHACVSLGSNGHRCEATHLSADTLCDDGEFCTLEDHCDGAGACTGGRPNPCDSVAGQCVKAECVEASDTCEAEHEADGSECDDADPCSARSVCSGGLCLGTDLICGEERVSAGAAAGDSLPAIGDRGRGRFFALWTGEDRRQARGRRVSTEMLREGREIVVAEVAAGHDPAEVASVAAAAFPDGTVVTAAWRKGWSAACVACCDCDCADREWEAASTSEIVVSWWEPDGSTIDNATIPLDRTEALKKGHPCEGPAALPLSAGSDQRIGTFDDGYTMIMWSRLGTLQGRVFDPAFQRDSDIEGLDPAPWGYDIALLPQGRIAFARASESGVAVRLHERSGLDIGEEHVVAAAPAGAELHEPRIGALSSGRLGVVWERREAGDVALFGQMLESSGELVGGPFEVSPSGSGPHHRPQALFHGGSGLLYVVWEGPDLDGSGIFLARFNKTGLAAGQHSQLNLSLLGDQSRPSLAFLGTAEMAVAWRAPSGHVDVRKLDLDGRPLDPAREQTAYRSPEGFPLDGLAAAGSGDRVIAAFEEPVEGGDFDTAGLLFEPAGGSAAVSLALHPPDPTWQRHPDAATDELGRFVAVWDGLGDGGSQEDVYLRLFSETGVAQGDAKMANESTAGVQQEPAAAMHAGGLFAVAWRSFGHSGGEGFDPMVRCFGVDGVGASAEIVVATDAAGDQDEVALVADPATAGYLMAWASPAPGDTQNLLTRRLTASCTSAKPQFYLATSIPGEVIRPTLSVAADGSAAVAWQSHDPGANGWDVYLQRTNPDGSLSGSASLVSEEPAEDQSAPALAHLADGTLLVAWTAAGEDEEGTAVKLRRYASDGRALGLPLQVHLDGRGDQDQPRLAVLQGGAYAVVWRDSAGGRSIASRVFGR